MDNESLVEFRVMVGRESATTLGTRAGRDAILLRTDKRPPHFFPVGRTVVRVPPTFPRPRPNIITLTSTNDFVSVFKDGKLTPGTYKTPNTVGQTTRHPSTYVNIPGSYVADPPQSSREMTGGAFHVPIWLLT